MRKTTIKHNIDSLAALLLFAVFAASVLAVLLTGARAYRGITLRDQSAYNARTCVQYIAQRVRQSDSLYGVTVEDFGEGQALVLGAGEEYITRIYCYNGYLMELYSQAGMDLGPEAGEKIIEVAAVSMSLDKGALHVEVQNLDQDGETRRDSHLTLSLRSGRRSEG